MVMSYWLRRVRIKRPVRGIVRVDALETGPTMAPARASVLEHP